METRLFSKKDKNQLLSAVARGEIRTVESLIAKGVPITTKSSVPGGKQALHLACEAQQENMLDKLIELGADINAKTNRGFTPLHVTAQTGNKHNLLALIKAGAQLDVTTDEGMGTTPLQEAANRGNLEALNILLAAGADPHYREKSFNKSASDLAELAGYPDICIALFGYQKAFIQRVDNILKEWKNQLRSETPAFAYWQNLRDIPINSNSDHYFMEIKNKLDQGYLPVKIEVLKLRSRIIETMKQYNTDKLLYQEVKNIMCLKLSTNALVL